MVSGQTTLYYTIRGRSDIPLYAGSIFHAHLFERMAALDLEPRGHDRLIIPQNEEVHFAQRVLSLLPCTPLYARVDLIHGEAGILRLMELELVEPGLWLSLAPQAVQCFADAIIRKMNISTEL